MRIVFLFLLAIGSIYASYRIFTASEKTPMPTPPAPKEDSLKISTVDTLSRDSLPTAWFYDTLAVHQLLEEMIKTYKDTLPLEFVTKLFVALNGISKSYPSEFVTKDSTIKIENFFHCTNMDTDAEKELILQIDDIDANVYVFDRINGIWKQRGHQIYESIAISGVANQGGTCEVHPQYRNISIKRTINYGSGVGEYLTDIYTYNGDTLILSLSMLEGFLLMSVIPLQITFTTKQIALEKIEATYTVEFLSLNNPQSNLKMPPLKALYVFNPKSRQFEIKTKLDVKKQKSTIGNEVGFLGKDIPALLCAYKKDIEALSKKGNKEQRKEASNLLKEMAIQKITCK